MLSQGAVVNRTIPDSWFYCHIIVYLYAYMYVTPQRQIRCFADCLYSCSMKIGLHKRWFELVDYMRIH